MPMTRSEMNAMAARMEAALDKMREAGLQDSHEYIMLWRDCRNLEERANRFGPM
jgi:hypothetical protein